jgi:hypothetical protein
MTVVINYVSDYLSIIMADRRVSYGRNAELGYTDDNVKLINLKEMGWAAGAGLSDYLIELKDKLSESHITSINQIMDIYNEVTTANIKKDPYFEQDIQNSAASFSFRNFDFEKKRVKFHIGLLTEDYVDDNGIKAVPLNKIHIFYPSDLLEDFVQGPKIAKSHDIKYESEDFGQLIYRVLTAFLDISKVSKFVSKECDMGIEILLPDGIYKLKISGNVDELIKKYNDNTLENEIEVINVIRAS